MSRKAARFEQAHHLSQLLVGIAEQAKVDFTEIAASLGLPVHLARAVVALSEPAPMRDLAGHLACDRSYITSLADQLEERGLVRRVTGDDRRIKLLQLTDEGLAVRKTISDAVAERALVLRRLDDQQRATLTPLLEALAGVDGGATADFFHGPGAPMPMR